MTDCPNGALRDLLPDLVHGRLSPAARRELEAHVSSCADCAAELALLRGLRASMARAPRVDPARISAAIPTYRAPVRRSWGGWRAAAAIAAIVVGGGSVAVVRQIGGRGPVAVQSVAASTHSEAPVAPGASPPPPVPAAQSAERAPRAVPAAARELAMTNGAASDLSERELQTLLKDIESIDAVPSVDVENAVPVSPISPKRTSE
ncbi:MAG: zf-HC2 domain-containing protein [Gemmatimonadota bacterium]|nr:zf-HC2 domain-containing protein [Gemmatimonadota bacterium]